MLPLPSGVHRQNLIGSRAGGLHSRTIEVFDQRGIADRFLSQGKVAQVAGFCRFGWTSATFPLGTRTGLRCGRTTSSASWPAGSSELTVPIYRDARSRVSRRTAPASLSSCPTAGPCGRLSRRVRRRTQCDP